MLRSPPRDFTWYNFWFTCCTEPCPTDNIATPLDFFLFSFSVETTLKRYLQSQFHYVSIMTKHGFASTLYHAQPNVNAKK